MIFDFGDVVVVPFPFTDQSASKRRLGVVISSADYSRVRPDVVFMAVTSQVRPDRRFGEALLLDWQHAGLMKPSSVKPLIATLEKSIFGPRLGRLSARDAASLRMALDEIIGDGTSNEV